MIISLIFASVFSSIVMIKLVDEYFVAKQVKDMDKAARIINDLAINYYMSDEYKNGMQGGSNWILLRNRVDLYSSVWNSYVFITDLNGRIIVSSPALPSMNDIAKNGYLDNNILSRLKYQDGGYYFSNKNQYVKCLQTSDSVIDKNDFYGLYNWSNSPWLSLSLKLDYTLNNETINFGTVTISTDIPEIKAARSDIIAGFIYSTIIGFIIFGTILSLFNAKISRSLKSLKHSANKVATGEYPEVLVIKSNDEIGDVVDSFNKMTSALSNLDKVRNDFIANVSHELRTPMTSIRGFIDGILDGTIPPEKQMYYLEIVKNEINRMNTMVNELLDIAKLQAGKQILNISEFDINKLIKGCIEKLHALFIEKNISIKTEFEYEVELVKADKGCIERVLINLLHNAIKFTKQDGAISVSTKRIKDIVEIAVSDNGIGISAEEQTMIFERFYKIDKSRSLDKKSTGLGLAIVKKILTAHEKDIRVESEIDKGAKFIFTLDK